MIVLALASQDKRFLKKKLFTNFYLRVPILFLKIGHHTV